MKPIIIESFGAQRPWSTPRGKLDDFARFAHLGDIEAHATSPHQWDFPLLIEALKPTCYVPRKTRHYPAFDFTFVNQSVNWHRDEGCGILVATLVAQGDGEAEKRGCIGERQALITRHGELPIRLGDMFVFNASLGHAWISYEACALACMTVKRKRNSGLS